MPSAFLARQHAESLLENFDEVLLQPFAPRHGRRRIPVLYWGGKASHGVENPVAGDYGFRMTLAPKTSHGHRQRS